MIVKMFQEIIGDARGCVAKWKVFSCICHTFIEFLLWTGHWDEGKDAKANILGAPYPHIKECNLRNLLSSFIKIDKTPKKSNCMIFG